MHFSKKHAATPDHLKIVTALEVKRGHSLWAFADWQPSSRHAEYCLFHGNNRNVKNCKTCFLFVLEICKILFANLP